MRNKLLLTERYLNSETAILLGKRVTRAFRSVLLLAGIVLVSTTMQNCHSITQIAKAIDSAAPPARVPVIVWHSDLATWPNDNNQYLRYHQFNPVVINTLQDRFVFLVQQGAFNTLHVIQDGDTIKEITTSTSAQLQALQSGKSFYISRDSTLDTATLVWKRMITLRLPENLQFGKQIHLQLIEESINHKYDGTAQKFSTPATIDLTLANDAPPVINAFGILSNNAGYDVLAKRVILSQGGTALDDRISANVSEHFTGGKPVSSSGGTVTLKVFNIMKDEIDQSATPNPPAHQQGTFVTPAINCNGITAASDQGNVVFKNGSQTIFTHPIRGTGSIDVWFDPGHCDFAVIVERGLGQQTDQQQVFFVKGLTSGLGTEIPGPIHEEIRSIKCSPDGTIWSVLSADALNLNQPTINLDFYNTDGLHGGFIGLSNCQVGQQSNAQITMQANNTATVPCNNGSSTCQLTL